MAEQKPQTPLDTGDPLTCGITAFDNGYPITTNPHELGTPAADAWAAGWHRAEDAFDEADDDDFEDDEDDWDDDDDDDDWDDDDDTPDEEQDFQEDRGVEEPMPDAFEMGAEAFHDKSANPFQLDTEPFTQWQNGWDSAKSISEKLSPPADKS